MNRVQKKCMIVSAGLHLLLAVMLIFGPGFLSSHSHETTPALMTAVPYATIEAVMNGGGDKSAKAPPAEATSPEPPTPNEVVVPPTPVAPPVQVTPPPVERVQPKQPEKELPPVPKEPTRVNSTPRIEPTPTKTPPRKSREIDVDLTMKTTTATDAKAKRDAQEKAAAAAEQKRLANIAAAFGQASKGIRHGVSSSTEVRIQGDGTGGVSYGNIQSAILTKYYQAWTVPDGVPDLKVYVSITLARDGSVIGSRITKSSGNANLDESVQKTLDRVRFVAPLPETETKDSMEFSFGFKPDMKE